jgi:16S rRNA (uracil1498-N3)-methyltransferase
MRYDRKHSIISQKFRRIKLRTTRIYQPGDYRTGQLLELSPEASQHVSVVLRMRPGEQLILFCGDNREFQARIEVIKKKQVMVLIDKVQEVNRESPLAIHLAQAISKGDRMDWVMQKTVELGVTSITPLISERCAVKIDPDRMEKKRDQWQKIVISACEQSGRNRVPTVYPPVLFADYVRLSSEKLKFILSPIGSKSWREYSLNHADLSLIVGPEGGLSDEEIKCACNYEFLPLSLGPRILRTETAAITALSVLQATSGDL